MKQLEVVETIEINAPAAVVRAQFADVAHHAESGVHDGVSFEVLSNDGQTCRYRQVTSVGPLRLKQEIELTVSDDGVMINRFLSGQFTGGFIEFVVSPTTDSMSRVQARISAPLRLHEAVVAPLVRRKVRRSLKDALIEDRNDIESGSYQQLKPLGNAR